VVVATDWCMFVLHSLFNSLLVVLLVHVDFGEVFQSSHHATLHPTATQNDVLPASYVWLVDGDKLWTSPNCHTLPSSQQDPSISDMSSPNQSTTDFEPTTTQSSTNTTT